MKLLLFYTMFSFNLHFGDYCDGFRNGFKDGYCYRESYCIPPIPPLCPMRRFGEDDTYTDGYKRGFIVGLNSK
jgi:hypothetical protein